MGLGRLAAHTLHSPTNSLNLSYMLGLQDGNWAEMP